MLGGAEGTGAVLADGQPKGDLRSPAYLYSLAMACVYARSRLDL